MTYQAQETSAQSGAPVELYQFIRGSTVYRYTSAEADIDDTDSTWVSTPISRSAIEVTPERVRNAINITVPRTNPVADLFRVSPPTDVVAVTIYRYHRQDLEEIVLWMGRVLGVDWQGARAVMRCEPVSTSVKRNGLRPVYSKNCRHVLFGSGCGLNRENFRHSTTVVSTSGRTLQVASVGAFPYGGGYVEWEQAPGEVERRFIREADTDGNLTLSTPFQSIPNGASVDLFPGCAHDTLTCDSVYDNLESFGGMPYLPNRNPFDGQPVY